MDRDSIHARLRNLDRKDKKRQVFGARGHNYVLNPPLDVGVIEAFELEHGVSLPEDYRQFITEIGNGGAGPAYGVFPFGQHDHFHGLCPWEGGYLVGDFGKPFRFNKAWNVDKKFWDAEPNPPEGTSQDEEDLLWQEWDKILEAKYWNTSIMDGAIPICHLWLCPAAMVGHQWRSTGLRVGRHESRQSRHRSRQEKRQAIDVLRLVLGLAQGSGAATWHFPLSRARSL